MPLIKKPKITDKKPQVRVRISKNVLNEIQDYCQWADLPSIDYFLEEVSTLALKKCKEWKEHRKSGADDKHTGA